MNLKNMRECDNSKTHISSNSLLSVYYSKNKIKDPKQFRPVVRMGNLKETDHLEDIKVGGGIILKCIKEI
jgi:hypothetical protein